MRRHRRFRSMTVNMSRTSVQRSFIFLVVATAFLFIVVGFLSASRVAVTFSSPSVKKLVSGVSSATLIRVIENGIPVSKQVVQAQNRTVQQQSMTDFVFELITSINPRDPRTFLGRELPGFETYDIDVLVAADGVNYTDFGRESPPPTDDFFVEKEGGGQEEQPDPESDVTDVQPDLDTDGEKVVFIYHTHNRESWRTIPELQNESNDSLLQHKTKNITLVGKKLAEELRRLGVKTMVNADDHLGQVPYSLAYASSRKVVQAAIQQNDDIAYFFDIHRDGLDREKTTVTINGQSYAQIFFVIGKANPHWEKNLAFAEQLHQKINEKYPGLSKGIIGKAENQGHGEYNQSVSPNSVIVEIGGIGNTLEESYRSAEALAQVIADIYWDAEKVNAPANQKQAS